MNEYYDGISRDLERRRERAAGQLPDDGSESAAQRRTVLEDKLAAARAEWEAKLADAEAKARLRVELELINLQVIHLPKVLLAVQIGNRTASVERTVVWDPLLHRIEPLACDVCGRAATRLMLCSGGHLAHEECLLAAAVYGLQACLLPPVRRPGELLRRMQGTGVPAQPQSLPSVRAVHLPRAPGALSRRCRPAGPRHARSRRAGRAAASSPASPASASGA